MTREQADQWVARGWSRWINRDTLEVQPGPPLMRYADPFHPGQEVVSEGAPSIVRFAERWPGEHSGRGEDGQGTRGGRGGRGQSPEQALATMMAMGMSEERARAMLGDRAPVMAKPAPGSRP